MCKEKNHWHFFLMYLKSSPTSMQFIEAGNNGTIIVIVVAYLNLGIVYGIIGKKEEASKMYRQCVEIDTAGLKDPRLHEHTKISALYNLGRLLADQDRYQVG